MTGRIIETEADVAEGAAWLAAQDDALARAIDTAGPLPLRRRADGFAALLNAIVGQQVSTASAGAIWLRIEKAGLDAPGPVLAVGEEGLRAVGLSRQKIAYATALAEAGIDYDALRTMPDSEVIATLTGVKGDRCVDGRDLRDVFPGPRGCFRAGRSRAAGSGALDLRSARTTQ